MDFQYLVLFGPYICHGSFCHAGTNYSLVVKCVVQDAFLNTRIPQGTYSLTFYIRKPRKEWKGTGDKNKPGKNMSVHLVPYS